MLNKVTVLNRGLKTIANMLSHYRISGSFRISCFGFRISKMGATSAHLTTEHSTRRLGLRQEVEAAGAAVEIKRPALVHALALHQWKGVLRGLIFLRHDERCPKVLVHVPDVGCSGQGMEGR